MPPPFWRKTAAPTSGSVSTRANGRRCASRSCIRRSIWLPKGRSARTSSTPPASTPSKSRRNGLSRTSSAGSRTAASPTSGSKAFPMSRARFPPNGTVRSSTRTDSSSTTIGQRRSRTMRRFRPTSPRNAPPCSRRRRRGMNTADARTARNSPPQDTSAPRKSTANGTS